MLTIAAFGNERSACTGYRVKDPLNKMKQLRMADVKMVGNIGQDTEGEIKKSDVVYFGRAASDNILKTINIVHSFKKKVVFDLDDDIFDISPYSQHYARLGIMGMEIKAPNGEVSTMWEDGRHGFDISDNRRFRASFVKVLQKVDAVTVTTQPLKELYSKFNRNVHVNPNSIDMYRWRTERIPKPEGWPVRLLYTGAANHQLDVVEMMPVLVELQRAHMDLRIAFVGTDWKSVKNELDYTRVDVHPWVDYEAYPYLLKSINADIGIAPIQRTFFDSCRSAIKYYEYSAIGIPTVATDFGPYKREMIDGKTGFLVDSDKEWFDRISELVKDKALRETVARNALRDVERNHSLDYQVETWEQNFKTITEN